MYRLQLNNGKLQFSTGGEKVSISHLGYYWKADRLVWEADHTFYGVWSILNEFKDAVELDDQLRATIDKPTGFDIKEFATLEKDKLLYPHQVDAVNYLLSSPNNALLALSMRFGKTVTSLYASRLAKYKNVLTVTTHILRDEWAGQSLTWSGQNATIINRKAPLKDEHGYFVINYERIPKFKAELQREWDLVIFDESILLKNHDTKRWQNAFDISKKSGKIWLLSGSPTSRYYDDLYAQFKLIKPNSFKSYWTFTKQFCYTEPSIWSGGDIVTGSKTHIPMREVFKDLMYVRGESDTTIKFAEPQVLQLKIPLTPLQKKTHKELIDNWETRLETMPEDEPLVVNSVLTEMIRLAQCVSNLTNLGPEWPNESSKQNTVIELIENGTVETPMIIWTHWRKTAETLKQTLLTKFTQLKTDVIIGGIKNRNEIIEKYKSGEINILVISLDVGRHGLTLTNTKTAIFFDKSFNPDSFIQARERTRAIGSDNNALNVVLSCPDTFDDDLATNLERKLRSMATITKADIITILKGIGK